MPLSTCRATTCQSKAMVSNPLDLADICACWLLHQPQQLLTDTWGGQHRPLTSLLNVRHASAAIIGYAAMAEPKVRCCAALLSLTHSMPIDGQISAVTQDWWHCR